MNLETMGQQAKYAASVLMKLANQQKNHVLIQIADALKANAERIVKANQQDLENARAQGMSDAMLDRLALNETRLMAIAEDIRHVTQLDDPVGCELESRVLDNGMRLTRRRVPLGVVGVIYEARPNVTIDITALCLKTGNAAILRGGKETLQTNLVIVDVIQQTLAQANLPKESIQYIDDPARERVAEFLRMDQYVDMIIPRGGEGLHRMCRENSTIPVIIGGFGISHIFVDESANQHKSLDVIENAKTSRPSTCNSLDTLLVNAAIAPEFLPKLAARMNQAGVQLVAETKAFQYLQTAHNVRKANEQSDFDTEWLSLVLSVKIVANIDEALSHMREHNASHSDAILTESLNQAQRFMNEVDSAAVYVNASTRFTDGGQFGLGAEVAVSTQKLHARGPMGLDALTSYKWIGVGDYLTRS
ncbi:glutamate-5-semialdehyde dehydrogenase [Celerinatantimonas diazotrophica]|uniref:Gamma-glutamyl phosphate reductase n=1 Tax=Celerinatantimonas diazotrophica TaxID=412034 RepID=A0A4R1K3J2_9GAMM|nr:glutamate-5-semialdehyde dehydrogenase [Celerinatantimonas diazotrophica]TCK58654.1 glutamate-5-semialdehyde dehydrogenase [Celerinatantimonas diazotrophica]CAG9297283.1 Gamma-glutamyl phosphate reductase [Celerinatantimonas diazotrophica]